MTRKSSAMLPRSKCAKGSIKKLKNGATVCCVKGAYKNGACMLGFTTVKGAR